MDKLLEGIKVAFPDRTTVDKWVPQSELIASRERVITLEKELEKTVEGFTEPEAKAFELQCELEVRDAWIRKLVAVKIAAANIIERVPVPIFLGGGDPDPRHAAYVGDNGDGLYYEPSNRESQLNEPVRYRLQIRRVGDSVAPLEPLWDALVELDEFGKAAK